MILIPKTWPKNRRIRNVLNIKEIELIEENDFAFVGKREEGVFFYVKKCWMVSPVQDRDELVESLKNELRQKRRR